MGFKKTALHITATLALVSAVYGLPWVLAGEGIRAAFPDWRLTLHEIVVEGDLAAFRATVTGTHEGALLNLPATGNEVATSALDMIRIRDGRFTDHWGGPDLFTLLQGCGGTLVPKG